MMTNEGADGVIELRKFLKKQKPIKELAWNTALMSSCKDLVSSQGPAGRVGQEDTFNRIKKYYDWQAFASESLKYNSDSPLGVLISLAISDGQSNRGNRNNLFSEAAAQVGIYTGAHSKYGSESCLEFSGSYRPLKHQKTQDIEIPQNVDEYWNSNFAYWDM